MNRWFRLYDDTINDPKSLKLSDKTFRIWIGILCVASKHDGALPPFEDIAIMLRIKPERLQPEIEKLIEVNLLDHDDDGLRPHNWSTRQYKSDVSTERVKRFRNGQRNVSCNVSETPPDTDTDTDKKDGGERRPTISEDAHQLASEIATIAGHDPTFPPPSWFGAPYRAQQWLNQGWPREIISTSIREQMARKRDGPPSKIEYFEKGIARSIAQQNAPLPQAPEVTRARNGKTTGNILDAADRLIERLAEFDERPDDLCGQTGEAPVRMLPDGRS